MLFMAAIAGCGDSDRYEMSKDAQGRTVRLDKKTGEIAVIGNDRVITLKSDKDAEAEKKSALDLHTPRSWSDVDIPQLGNVKAALSTSWRDGRTLYRFTVKPISKDLAAAQKKYMATLTLKLFDANGFVLARIPVIVGSMSRVVNDKGESIELSSNDSIEMSQDTYSSLVGWNVAWNF
jgi:hypothetical protein